ncbi:MAG: WG repeat-containing protein, partial [Allobaculum sp.]|nr:WG repeat-containing protein [Allobaculum sp.]
ILPFEYNSIGLFEEIPEGRGSNFTFGWRLIAPAQKDLKGTTYKCSIEILNSGSLMETYRSDIPYSQPLYPNEPRTYGVIKKQTLNVGNVKKTIYIQQIPWGHFGLTDENGNVVAPFIYDSIEPFSEYCSIPGPGVPQLFLGSKYRIGDDVGFFKITDDGIIIDYKRFSQETYRRLQILT